MDTVFFTAAYSNARCPVPRDSTRERRTAPHSSSQFQHERHAPSITQEIQVPEWFTTPPRSQWQAISHGSATAFKSCRLFLRFTRHTSSHSAVTAATEGLGLLRPLEGTLRCSSVAVRTHQLISYAMLLRFTGGASRELRGARARTRAFLFVNIHTWFGSHVVLTQ